MGINYMVDLGDKVKSYENEEARRILPPVQPIVVRLDGRGFSKWTRDLAIPFDAGFRRLMEKTARDVAEEANAVFCHTQSDEITLVLRGNGNPVGSLAYFGGRIQKMVSSLAARASVVFNASLAEYLPVKAGQSSLPTFDCRVWSVPTEQDACDVIRWREADARVNSVSMVARTHFSHSQVFEKSTKELVTMLSNKGERFYDYPVEFRRGIHIQRKLVERTFTASEMENLPKKHRARTTPDLMVLRKDLVKVNLPPFCIISNAVNVVFNGADPVTQEESNGRDSFTEEDHI